MECWASFPAQTERRGRVGPVEDLPGAGTYRPLRLFARESAWCRAGGGLLGRKDPAGRFAWIVVSQLSRTRIWHPNFSRSLRQIFLLGFMRLQGRRQFRAAASKPVAKRLTCWIEITCLLGIDDSLLQERLAPVRSPRSRRKTPTVSSNIARLCCRHESAGNSFASPSKSRQGLAMLLLRCRHILVAEHPAQAVVNVSQTEAVVLYFR